MRFVLLMFLSSAAVFAYVQRLALSLPSKEIEEELGLGPEGMGTVMAAWYWGYALCQLPTGRVADRIGSKSALLLFALGWSSLTALTGLATGFLGLLLIWGLMGCFQAGLLPCSTKAVGATFPKSEQGIATGMLTACMSLGAALSQWLTGQLLGPLSWQSILLLYALSGLVWALAFALIVPRPEPPRLQPLITDQATPPIRWSRLVTDRQMVLICFQQFLRASAVAFFYTWFPRYLMETRGLSKEEAGSFAFWPPIAGMFGGLLSGFVSDGLLRMTGSVRLARQGLGFVAMLICTGVALGSYFATDTRSAVLLICVGSFCGIGGGVGAYALIISYGGRQVATVFATMNMSGNIGAGLFPFVVGFLVAATGTWDVALLLFVCLFALCALCWAFMNPTGTLFDDPEKST